MSKHQRAFTEFDYSEVKEFTGIGEFMKIHGAKLLKQIAVTVTAAMALNVSLVILFG